MSNSTASNGSLQITLKGVIAVVGCDGSGKSTLSADLLTKLGEKGSVTRRYLGLVSGETGDKIKKLPFVGVKLERYLNAKAQRAQDIKKKLPSSGAAIVMYLFSWWRALSLLRLMRLSKRGGYVIVDRYPQAEIPGFHYDGPGLTADRTESWLIRKLAVREHKLYQWMAKHKPELVIRLNIDADTAYARKPDHNILELRDKISIMPHLSFNGAHILDLDATDPYPQVLATALQEIKKLQ